MSDTKYINIILGNSGEYIYTADLPRGISAVFSDTDMTYRYSVMQSGRGIIRWNEVAGMIVVHSSVGTYSKKIHRFTNIALAAAHMNAELRRALGTEPQPVAAPEVCEVGSRRIILRRSVHETNRNNPKRRRRSGGYKTTRCRPSCISS